MTVQAKKKHDTQDNDKTDERGKLGTDGDGAVFAEVVFNDMRRSMLPQSMQRSSMDRWMRGTTSSRGRKMKYRSGYSQQTRDKAKMDLFFF